MTDTMTEHVISTLGRRGDSRFSWNPRNQTEVDEAERHFNELKAKGYRAFRVNEEGEKAGQMSDFDREAREILMVPQIVGG
jgi:hypothetical protein